MLVVVTVFAALGAGPFAIIYLGFKVRKEKDLILKKKLKREVLWFLYGWLSLLLFVFLFNFWTLWGLSHGYIMP